MDRARWGKAGAEGMGMECTGEGGLGWEEGVGGGRAVLLKRPEGGRARKTGELEVVVMVVVVAVAAAAVVVVFVVVVGGGGKRW